MSEDKIKMWTNGVPVEEAALQQIKNISSLPFIFKHVAVMPDVHYGKGATVGTVIATKGAIIPAAVGVDIGCGMEAIRLNIKASQLPDHLAGLRSEIESRIPLGMNSHEKDVPMSSVAGWKRLKPNYDLLMEREPDLREGRDPSKQVGTLGGGNHFIELCLDEEQNAWVMLHSGSRGIGNRIGTQFIAMAKEDMLRLGVSLPDKDLAYLEEGSQYYNRYIDAVCFAQEYAAQNRRAMMIQVLDAIARQFPHVDISNSEPEHAISCHHNYVNIEPHFGEHVIVTRKGAVNASLGKLGIIPGSMGAKSYIVRGKGNPDSFNSCSHGAGRKMSRGQARRTFTVLDHMKATFGIECRKDEGVLDETPDAYKDIENVMAAQSDLVEVVHTLKQVLCVKG